jgi:hypothetical protein
LNTAEEDRSHDYGSTFLNFARAKPARRIMAASAPAGYPMPALILRKDPM